MWPPRQPCALPGDAGFCWPELVARGVEMEAYSVEDEGRGVCFHVYCYNVQPGVEIDLRNRGELGGMIEAVERV